MVNETTFLSPGGLSNEALSSIVIDSFGLESEPRKRSSIGILDTFDWRLHRSGFWLVRTPDGLELRDIQKNEIVESLATGSTPEFAWDIPNSPLKERISKALEVRALIPLVHARVESRRFRILDDEQKTVVRLELRTIRVGSGRGKHNRIALASIHPVRGYPSQARRLAGLLADAGQTRGSLGDVYLFLLAAEGREPGDYNPKPPYSLDPEMHSDEAARIIYRHLLYVIRANEAGIIADIDTEFLHDYRVSVRRTRSALSQVKGVFPSRVVGRFKADFKYLGTLTNPLRDLDVYLLKEAAYRAMLPGNLREDIDPLFDLLKRKRIQAHRAVVRGMGTKKYAKIFDSWAEFLGPPEPERSGKDAADDVQYEMELALDPDAPNAWRPVIKLARARIRKRYQLVVRTGEEIKDTGTDEALHGLRIECKKLRYLLEFFHSLFPAEKIDFLIKQLKRLQDNLGDFNDLSVQQGYLLGISEELPQNKQSVRTLLAVGALVGELEARQREVKEAFADTFAEFASPDNQALFNELFGKQS
ncbi:MAG: CHAD domain-containing protein [Anaerolineales bacterium]|nr:CHAD domain-containing protein [Anaerolineales bacterium]